MLLNKEHNNKQIDYSIGLILIGLFIFPMFIRRIFLANGNLYQINFFAALGCLLVIYKTLQGGKLKRRDMLYYSLFTILTLLLIISELHAGRTVMGFVRVFIGLIMPLPLLYYRMRNPKNTIRFILNTFICVSIIVVTIAVIDIILGKRLMVAFFNLANDSNFANMAASNLRLYSYIGHPLYNAELFIMTLGLNYTYNEIFVKSHKNDKWVILVTMIGIAMTASKSAIVIFLALIILLYIKNIRYMLFSFALLTVSYFNGLFDIVLSRFSWSLTSGRSEVWERISSKGIDFFHFFWGNGSDSKYNFSYLEDWARAAFEYPYRLYALEFGILFTIIIFLYLFVIPEYKLIKNRTNWKLLSIIFLGVVAHVNIYNGIGTYTDALYLYCLYGCTVLNISSLGRMEASKN